MRFDKHIIIVGSARSGTSWLAETIASQHRYRLLFEPEHEFHTQKGVLICDRHITCTNASNELEEYLTKVFSNRVDNDWIAQASNRKFKRHLLPIIPKKYIIKFVRANLAAFYLKNRFDIPVIHIIRNPYEVIFSQQRVNFPWLYDLKFFLEQKALMDLIKKDYHLDIPEANFSKLQILALRWCLENVVPMHINPDYSASVRIVKHENLKNDISLFHLLCREYNFIPVSDLDKRYRIPSSKTHSRSSIRSGIEETLKFTKLEFNEINYILDKFEVSCYNRDEFTVSH